MDVFVGDLTMMSSDLRAGIITNLGGFFNRCMSGIAGATCTVRVVEESVFSMNNTDLLCYIVQGKASSVVKNFANMPNAPVGTHKGWTNVNAAARSAASELYFGEISNADADIISKLIFHELMHNKGLATNHDLHSIRGIGLGAATVTPGSVLTTADIAFMAGVIPNAVNQWSGGFSF